MLRPLAALLVAAALGSPASIHAKSKPKAEHDTILRVVTPANRGTAPAHPFVNVIVRFGTTSTGLGADPSTFRAKIAGSDVTDQFTDDVENGAVVGKRAMLQEPLVRVGRRNRLRLSVRSEDPSGKKRPFTDHDLVRFKVERADNQPPPASITPVDCFVIGIETRFDAGAVSDPEQDSVTFTWDFGDGTSATGTSVAHTFDGADVARTVTLTTSDGQASTRATLELQPAPPCDDSALPGIIDLTADGPLEFHGVAPGGTAQKTFTIRNDGADPKSQVKARVCSEAAAFSIEPKEVVLGPGQSMPVTVTFHPTGVGHASARVALGACASNQQAVAFLAHGYGGDSSTSGPTLAPDPAYFQGILPNQPRFGIMRLQPDGSRTVVDNTTHWCVQSNGNGSRDLCFADADCAQPGEHCVDPGQSTVALDPSDFCADPDGNLYILTEDAILDLSGNDEEVTGVVARIHMDDQGNRTNATMLQRITGQTTQLACDRDAPSKNGLVYIAEYHVVHPGEVCARDSQEALTALRKNNGVRIPVGPNPIDGVEVPPLDPCDDEYDPVTDLNTSFDGNTQYSLPENGGIYRLRPSPLPVLIPAATFNTVNPDEKPAFTGDHFNVHPDGAILYPIAVDVGGTGTINLYKVYAEQAENGPLHVEDLTPCATFSIPNNRSADQIRLHRRATIVYSFGTTRTSAGADDGVTLVSFATVGEGGSPSALGSRSNLQVQGTVAFTSPAGSPTCSVAGLVNLDLLQDLTF